MRTRFYAGSKAKRVAECLGLAPSPVDMFAADAGISEDDVSRAIHELHRLHGIPVYYGRDVRGYRTYHTNAIGLDMIDKRVRHTCLVTD